MNPLIRVPRLLPLLFALLLILLPPSLRAVIFDSSTVKIGDSTIILPGEIDQFPRLDGKSAELDANVLALFPRDSGVRILAFYGTQSDLASALRNETPDLSRTIAIQSVIKLEDKRLPFALFPDYKKNAYSYFQQGDYQSAAKLLQKIEASASDAVSKQTSIDTLFQYGHMVPLGIFQETSNSLSHSLLTQAEVTTNGETLKFIQATSVAVLYLDGKIISLYVTALYHSMADLEWTRQTALASRDALIAANRDKIPPEEIDPLPAAKDASPAAATNLDFTTVNIAGYFTFQLPNDWLLGMIKNTVASSSAALAQLADPSSLPSGRPPRVLAAHSLPLSTGASLDIGTAPSSFTLAQYNLVTEAVLKALPPKLAKPGDLSPRETTKETIGGIPMLISRYRAESDDGIAQIQFLHLFFQDRQFDIKISCLESKTSQWQSTIDTILHSIKALPRSE